MTAEAEMRASERSAGRAGGLAALLRSRLFELYVLLMSLGVGASIVVYYHWTKRPHEVRGLLRFWSRNFIWGARAILGLGWRIEGAENIPGRAVIFVGNHQSYWESIAMTVFFPDINVVTKRASMQIPVFGWGLTHAPMIPVDRDQPGRNIRRLLRQGPASLRAGRSLLIFPEGGRVPVGVTRPFHRGVDRLYALSDAPVVPFVTNAGLFWPSGLATKRSGTVTMRFLPPIPPGRDPMAFMAELEETIVRERDRLLRETG